MPTTLYTVGTTQTTISADAQRTVLVIQNVDTIGTDYIYVSDSSGQGATTGIRLSGQGSSITLRRCRGEQPEKAWYLIAATAATPVRVMSLFGVVSGGDGEPEEPNPQEPQPVLDAPNMAKQKYVAVSYTHLTLPTNREV